MVIILPLTIAKDMNFEYISQRFPNQQFKCKKQRIPPIAAAITDFVSNAPAICEEAEQILCDGGSIWHVILWEKNIRCQDAGLKCTSCVILNFSSASIVFDGYPETLNTTDNTYKCHSKSYFKEKRMQEQCQ